MSGLGKLTTYAATTGYIGSVGLPLAPLGWAIAVAFEIGGGLPLVLGFRTREVAFGAVLPWGSRSADPLLHRSRKLRGGRNS
jgi:uncharacterized membrane protein YphA (DoxX/SURF4 family)